MAEKASFTSAVPGTQELQAHSRALSGGEGEEERREAWEDKKERWMWGEEGKRICLSCQLGALLSLSLGWCNLLGPITLPQNRSFVSFAGISYGGRKLSENPVNSFKISVFGSSVLLPAACRVCCMVDMT